METDRESDRVSVLVSDIEFATVGEREPDLDLVSVTVREGECDGLTVHDMKEEGV